MNKEFDWDQNKAACNLSKHGITFDEAITVFEDPMYLDFFDPDHSYEEQRYIRLGYSSKNRLLIVSYAEYHDMIRIISARKATRKERLDYEEE